MKKPLAAIAASAFLLLAAHAFAQPASPQATEQEQVQREAQEAQNRANERAMAAKTAQPKPFDELDRNEAGQLDPDDARHDAWLAEHFAQCDVDGDNRVSRDEYAACTEKRE